jgi:ABC-type dipeptide/oligopeptide/nickel transport system permease component
MELSRILYSFFILLWLLVISFSAFLVVFYNSHRWRTQAYIESLQLPAMILGPLLIVSVYLVVQENLILPVSFLTSDGEMFLRCLAPAVVLAFASGLLGGIINSGIHECQVMAAKPFNLAARAYGKNPRKALFPTVFALSFTHTWIKCLPLIFGEMLLVEVIFQAPGLGQLAWISARSRDYATLWACLGVTSLLYLSFLGTGFWHHQKIGRRLKGYL